MLEAVYWDASAARLLKSRTRGSVFVTHRRPGPGKVVGPRDVCPDTGFARLSYGQARALLDAHTALGGPGIGWDLHEFRHSALTHLGEGGASLLMLMAKSRHRKPENLRRYFHPLPEAIASGEVTVHGRCGHHPPTVSCCYAGERRNRTRRGSRRHSGQLGSPSIGFPSSGAHHKPHRAWCRPPAALGT